MRELNAYLALVPDHDRALRLRARAWTAFGQSLKAVRDWDRAIAVSKRVTPDDYFERAKLLSALGGDAVQEALAGLDEGLERLGPVVSLAFMAIDLEVQLGHTDAALERLAEIEPQFARKEIVLERRGHILLAAGRRTEARGAFVAALSELETLPTHRRSTRAVESLEARLQQVLAELLDDAEAER